MHFEPAKDDRFQVLWYHTVRAVAAAGKSGGLKLPNPPWPRVSNGSMGHGVTPLDPLPTVPWHAAGYKTASCWLTTWFPAQSYEAVCLGLEDNFQLPGSIARLYRHNVKTAIQCSSRLTRVCPWTVQTCRITLPRDTS